MKAVAQQIWHLFVDSGAFTAVVLVWLVVVASARSQLGDSAGVVLFAGLAILLMVNVFVRARRSSLLP